MSRFGCTITVATGKVPSSQSDFTWKAVTANFPIGAKDGGADSILNGGGNLRAYVDDTKAVQLPVEIVTFVTGGSPDIEVWGRSPTLNVASTVYIEADTVATSQPAVTVTYGRNNVWQDYHFASHDGVINSTGSGATTTTTGTPVFNSDGVDLDGATVIYDVASLEDVELVSLKFDVTVVGSSNNKFFVAAGGGGFFDGGFGVGNFGSGNKSLRSFKGNDNGNILASSGSNAYVNNVIFTAHGTYDQTVGIVIYVDGSPIASGATSGDYKGINPELKIGNANADIIIHNVYAYQGVISADRATSEFNNQDSPASFWTTSAWEDQDAGGGITADGAITLPSLVFAGSATDSTSEITAAGDITLPSLVFAGSATDSTSEVTAAGDITLPSLVFAGSATDSTSEVTAAGDITLPSLVFAGSATDSTSEITAAGDITLPSLVFAGSATDSTSEITAAGDITLPSLVFAGSATDSTSEITAAGDITLPSLVFAGSASTSEVGQVTAAGDITLPSLVFAGSATDSTSEITAAGDITLPSLLFQGNASDSTSKITATGAITLPSLVFAGSATDTETTEVTASGAITLPSLVFQGSATDSTSEVTVSGAITLPSLVFAGNATAGQVISDFTIQIDNTAKIIETTPNSFTIRI